MQLSVLYKRNTILLILSQGCYPTLEWVKIDAQKIIEIGNTVYIIMATVKTVS